MASRCVETLSKGQRTSLDGEADRLGDPRLTQWLFGRSLLAATPVTPRSPIMLASLETTANVGKARALHTQGLSAYQAGRYDFAVRKFAAALDAAPSPELLYHAAQAYRLKGERAKALEHYERYLEVAPDGPAANACRVQVERLRDALP